MTRRRVSPGAGSPHGDVEDLARVGPHLDAEVVAPERAVDDSHGDAIARRARGGQREPVGPDRDERAEGACDVVAEELGDERRRGSLPHRRGISILFHPAGADDDDAVGERERLLVVVGHEQDRARPSGEDGP